MLPFQAHSMWLSFDPYISPQLIEKKYIYKYNNNNNNNNNNTPNKTNNQKPETVNHILPTTDLWSKLKRKLAAECRFLDIITGTGITGIFPP